jgi:hypothetical protein
MMHLQLCTMRFSTLSKSHPPYVGHCSGYEHQWSITTAAAKWDDRFLPKPTFYELQNLNTAASHIELRVLAWCVVCGATNFRKYTHGSGDKFVVAHISKTKLGNSCVVLSHI